MFESCAKHFTCDARRFENRAGCFESDARHFESGAERLKCDARRIENRAKCFVSCAKSSKSGAKKKNNGKISQNGCFFSKRGAVRKGGYFGKEINGRRDGPESAVFKTPK